VLYGFQGGNDGAGPIAGLINVNGTLYGTTYGGGRGGTVFSITPSGVETVLHHFECASDGCFPYGGLTDLRGTLYGTTSTGGANGDTAGTVFSITPRGVTTGLYSFQPNSTDGGSPYAGLTKLNSTLYGTTSGGGNGTVFSISPGGGETVLYSFSGGNDGGLPWADLLNDRGTLYGTTKFRGANSNGTVFSITPPGGVLTPLYSFQGGSDGANPQARLMELNGRLYGTTAFGGDVKKCPGGTRPPTPPGCGTVFELIPPAVVGGAVTERVIYRFKGGGSDNDGDQPLAGLTNVNGALYGTTSAGGGSGCFGHGCGTVFKLTPPVVARSPWTEEVIHSFQGGGDGATPMARLINVNGTLYGTTAGTGADGNGTVFSITP
jgi:uncharacterized repeat protein (TIGR03803 family)